MKVAKTKRTGLSRLKLLVIYIPPTAHKLRKILRPVLPSTAASSYCGGLARWS